jgi:hypothetical protein
MFTEIKNYRQDEHLIARIKNNILCNVEQSQRRIPVTPLDPVTSEVAREGLVQIHSTQQSIQIQFYQIYSN